MANNRYVYQQTTNVSINKNKLLDIASNQALSKKDYRVLLCLFTELNGWSADPLPRAKDPLNYKKIDISKIADVLNLKKKEIKECISTLIEAEIIEEGDSETIQNGYRFLF